MKSKYCNKPRRTSRQHQNYQIFSNQKNVIQEKESNLGRFWRECRERDIRKRRKMSQQFASNHNHFNSTIAQLKLDADILSNRFQRINSIKNMKENRRDSMCFTNYPNISKVNKNTNRRLSNIYIPSSTNVSNNNTNDEKIQSENSKMLFENKQYYSSLYNKYHQQSRKSNIRCVDNYLDSSKNDENKLKHRLRQKWQELKKDVNKLNYFNKSKLNKKTTNQNQINLKNTTIQQPVKKEVFNNTHDSLQNDIHQNLTYCFKPPTKNIEKNPEKHKEKNIEQKDQESRSNESITELESEIVESEIVEDITLDNVQNENIKQSEIIKDKHSSIYCLSNVEKSNEYWDYSVRQLKNKLVNMNVSIHNCIEKKDLIERIKTYESNTNNKESTNISNNIYYRNRKQAPKAANCIHRKCRSFPNKNKPSILYDTIFNDTRESKQQIMKRVDLWIHRWSYRRSFRQLLNSINIFEYKANDRRYISRGDENYLLMMKLYKKAILLIHPDKHVNSSFEIKYKSAEMFKILVNLAEKYKKKHA